MSFFVLFLIRTLLLITCIVTGMMAVSGGIKEWRHLSETVEKAKIGGDFEVGQWGTPLPYDLTAFMLFASKDISRIQEASLAANHGGYYANVSIKGIDNSYPLYGSLQMETGKNIYPFAYDATQKVHGAVVDKRTLKVLNLKMNDRFTVGKTNFAVTGILIA